MIITLCNEEVCPVFPVSVKRLHWPIPDPASTTGDEDDVLAVFRTVRDQIRKRVSTLL